MEDDDMSEGGPASTTPCSLRRFGMIRTGEGVERREEEKEEEEEEAAGLIRPSYGLQR